MKKYRDLLHQLKDEQIDGRTVTEWESDLSAYNKKTLDFEAFKVYIQNKNALNARLAPFYNRYLFRKLKLGSYCRRQITGIYPIYTSIFDFNLQSPSFTPFMIS